jgi:mRNA interferase RelE/StbE
MTQRNPYAVVFSPAVSQRIRKLDPGTRARLVARIEALGADPRPPGCVALQGAQGLLRIRMGDWRIVYRVEDKSLVVLIVRVGHRREVYRGQDF